MKFQLIRQRDVMQCGAASLTMVCRHYGRNIDITQVEQLCGVTRRGISMLSLTNASAELGLETKTLHRTLSELACGPFPCILHWNQNHFVVLYDVDKQGTRFRIADPAIGLTNCSAQEMQQHWISTTHNGNECGIAMFFSPRPDFFTKAKKRKNKNAGTFSYLKRYAKPFKREFAVITLCLAIGCILQLLLPFLTQNIVDVGIENKNIGYIWLVLLGQLSIVAGRTATDFIRRKLLLKISMKVNISLVSDFFTKLLKLPMSFFETKLLGDLLQRIADHSRVQQFLTTQMLSVMFAIVSFFVLGIVLLTYNLMVFSVFFAGSFLYAIWIAVFLKRRRFLDFELFDKQGTNQSLTYEFVTNIQEIKLQNCEYRRKTEWKNNQDELFAVQIKSLNLQQTQEAGGIFINEMKNVLTTVLAATAVINGEMTLGAMLAIQYIIGQLNSPVQQLMAFLYTMQDVKLSLERIGEIHNTENEQTSEKKHTDFYSNDKSLRLSHVNFKYEQHALQFTLNDICLDIPEGTVTAIVGASGSGKTTLMKLLMGYYKIQGGKITIAGDDIRNYNLKWWRSQCGVVMQDGVIFSESIARNIAVEDGNIDRDKLEEAANKANIHSFIKTLPLGYDTKIGREGTNLSQGQKQRILIARAIYKNPDYIFLDEATNSLDTNNEKQIVAELKDFYKGRTVIVVAHRLSTIRHADQIVVLDNGKIVECGTHDILIKQHGYYYNLIKNQLELQKIE